MPEPIAREVAAHYDELDLFYRRVWGEQIHHGLWLRGDESSEEAARGVANLVKERLGLKAGQRVCDVGCGYGRIAGEMAAASGVRVMGLTLSSRQAEVARKRADPGVEVRAGNWLEWEIPEGSFDAVFAVESLEHMERPGRAIAKMATALKPGGRMALCCWLLAPDMLGWERRHLIGPIRESGHLAGMSTGDDVIRWIRSAGLKLESVEDFSRQVERTWPLCLRRSLSGMIRDPELRRYFLRHGGRNFGFALSLLRIWTAYLTGALRYQVFTATKPEASGLDP